LRGRESEGYDEGMSLLEEEKLVIVSQSAVASKRKFQPRTKLEVTWAVANL
jgi:urease gamma subunit